MESPADPVRPVTAAGRVPSGRPGGLPALRPAGTGGVVTQQEVDALEADVVPALTALAASLVEEVFSETLPLVGDRFSAVWDNNVAGFRFLERLRIAAREGLAALTGGGPFTPVQVQNAINGRLTANGFNAGSRVLVTTANDHVQLAFETVDTFSSVAVPIATDFGLPNLDLDLLAPANASTSGSLVCHFTLGLDASGFYLDEAAPQTITFNTTTTLSTGLNARVRFAKLPFRLNDDASPRSSLTANFSLRLRDPDGSGKIRLGEMNGLPDLVDGTVTGQAALSMAVTSDLPEAAAMLKVRTDLGLAWNFSQPQNLNEDDDNADFGNAPPQLTFTAASLNVRSVFKTFANRLLRGIADVTSPLDELIAVLTAEVPLLSDLGSDAVTILDVAGATPEQVAAIEALDALSTLARWTTDATTADTVWMNMGSFRFGVGDLRTQPLDELQRFTDAGPGSVPADLASFLAEVDAIPGLQFPLLRDGTLLADLIAGRPVNMFSYQSQEIRLEEDFQVFYPVLGPVGVTLGGRAGVRTRFGFGFDAQGVFDFAAAGDNADPALVFNGFYAMAQDENGDPFTGISLYAGITAGVEANVVIASVGVEGDITAEIGMYLDDQLGDEFGRVRGSTIRALPFADLFYAAGSLSAGLRVYVEVGIPPFSVGYDWESPRVTLINFDSRDNEVPVLAELNGNGTLVLNVGERSARRIHGNLDDRAEEFTIGGIAGTVQVTAFDEDNQFTDVVRILGEPNLRGDVIELAEDLALPAELNGGDGRDILTGGAAADVLRGGDGPDKLRGRGGNNELYGGADNDELTGGPGADLYHGGPGDDTASWADDIAAISMDLRSGSFGGAAAIDTLVSIERYRGTPLNDVLDGSEGADSLLSGEGGHDTVRGHGGDDLLEGDGGDDVIDGGAGDDMVIGGPGADQMDGGSGTDTLSYLAAAIPNLPDGVRMEPVTVNMGTGTGSRGDALGDTFSGFEILIGSGVPAGYDTPSGTGDDLTGSDNADIIHGMGGTDLIRGGAGDDILYGDSELADSPLMPDFDADRIHGDAGNDAIYGQWDADRLFGGEGNDLLDGGPGDDELDGGPDDDELIGGEGDDHLITNDPAGTDTLDGGAGYNRLSADYSDKTTPLRFAVGPAANGHTFSGGDGFSNMHTLGVLTTGGGNDVIRLAAQLEPGFRFSKTVTAGAGDDLVIADNRGFYPPSPGSRTNDSLHGGEGVDTISFEQSSGGVIVNLGTLGLGGAATGMTMSGFENIIGSEHVDDLTGDGGDNVLTPLQGGQSRADGADRVTGGGGSDTLRLDFSNDPAANVNGVYMTPNWTSGYEWINRGPVGGLAEATHYYIGIERFEITGTSRRDVLYSEGLGGDGTNFNDRFLGLGGNDHLDTRMGHDYIDGGEGDDTIEAGTGNDTVLGGEGNDSITFDFADNFMSAYGADTVDAGPGDDVIYNLRYSDADPSGATATTLFRCDGGPGRDTLSGDCGHQTVPVIFDEANPTDMEWPDGSYFRSIEQLRRFHATKGNDVIICRGRLPNALGLGDGDDVVNPGLGQDTVVGGAGTDLLILDYSVGDDEDTGGVTFASTGSLLQRRRLSDNALLDSIFSGSCENTRITGSSKDDVLNAFANGVDIIHGGPGNDSMETRGGNDYLDGGPGRDTLNGGQNNDTYIVDETTDVVVESLSTYGTDTVIASADFTLPVNVEHLTLTGPAMNGTGNAGANIMLGNPRNNTLRGEGGNDTLDGGGGGAEIDRLNGGANADTFVLGDGSGRFYDDGDPASPGHEGYAIIEDFTPSQSDRLRLTGSPSQYFLGASPIAGIAGTALYHDSNASGALESATDELIALIISTETLTPANTLTSGNYPAAVTLAAAGLGAPPVPLARNDGSGTLPAIGFTISDPLPANLRLEVQASTDMGVTDTWVAIATKTGAGAWTGSAEISTTTLGDGQAALTVTDVRPLPGITRRFLRLRVSSL